MLAKELDRKTTNIPVLKIAFCMTCMTCFYWILADRMTEHFRDAFDGSIFIRVVAHRIIAHDNYIHDTDNV